MTSQEPLKVSSMLSAAFQGLQCEGQVCSWQGSCEWSERLRQTGREAGADSVARREQKKAALPAHLSGMVSMTRSGCEGKGVNQSCSWGPGTEFQIKYEIKALKTVWGTYAQESLAWHEEYGQRPSRTRARANRETEGQPEGMCRGVLPAAGACALSGTVAKPSSTAYWETA